jgi:NADH dehydrogenase [ubiquinone] 1 alpha subcomplex assembly factor 8
MKAASQLERFALHATKTCAVQAAAYGECVLATYRDIKQNACAEEFRQFKECLQKAVRVLPTVLSLFANGLLKFQMKKRW